MVRIGLNGELAVKSGSGYKTYNAKTKQLVNVQDFCFDIGQDLFICVPTAKVKVGDIIVLDDPDAPQGVAPKCVTALEDGKTIKVMDYRTNEIQTIVPERHFFLGKMFFYNKIHSLIPIGDLAGSKGTDKFGKLLGKMAPRKITKLPKDAYGTEVEIGDIVVWEGRVSKVKCIISEITINKKRMFTRDCVVVRTNNPNKKLGWVEYFENKEKEQ